ncbi:carboxypeptidase N regulatory subunit [Mytilus galloprovincialis]|uniref:Carboxypeptidase N regulatory subunit n=1 Tax=Mytilus galloprovincialis TaxID=29158 RepID=A0A8B6GWL0_MYTGA|nr:carboxypeptidase N regulatory subunit [Mytilus galloprovincialis]
MIFTTLFIVIVSLLEQVSAIPCAGPQGSFCDCIGTIIRCNSQGLTDTFDGVPTNTTELDLSFNKITNIAANAFDDLVSLELLDLGRNNISNIAADAFGDLVSLKSLDLSNNNLSSLPSELFMFNMNLVKVDLSNNHVSSLPSGFFSSMINVYEIKLRNNPLICCNMTDFIEWSIKKQLKDDDINCIELSSSIAYEDFDISNCTFPESCKDAGENLKKDVEYQSKTIRKELSPQI